MTFVIIAVVSGLIALPGVRLLALARQTHKRPESLLAVFFLAAGAGMFARLLGAGDVLPAGATSNTVTLVSHVLLTSGILAAISFAREVFRPTHVLANRLAHTLRALLLMSCAGLFLPGNVGDEGNGAIFFANASRILPFLWLFAESTLQFAKMRRQGRLGIGDPIVTNRFLLWSIWTGGIAALPIIVIGFRIATLFSDPGLDGDTLLAALERTLEQIRIILLPLGFTIATTVWLSFFPTERYLRWIASRAAQSA